MKYRVLGLMVGTLLITPTSAFAGPVACAVAGNLVQNCGFELGVVGGNPVGWTVNSGFTSTGFNFVTGADFNSGSLSLLMGNFTSQPVATASQTMTTVAGGQYTVSLFVKDNGFNQSANAFFDVKVDGTTDLALTDTALNAWTNHSFVFTGTGSDTLSVSGATDFLEWLVDDVVVQCTSSCSRSTGVPEPVTLSLFGAGVAGLIAIRRRKKKTV